MVGICISLSGEVAVGDQHDFVNALGIARHGQTHNCLGVARFFADPFLGCELDVGHCVDFGGVHFCPFPLARPTLVEWTTELHLVVSCARPTQPIISDKPRVRNVVLLSAPLVCVSDERGQEMKTFGMYTNEGDVALAHKLNEALGAMPDNLNIDERIMFIKDALRTDSEFCANHSEWNDTDVLDAIGWWAEHTTKLKIRDCEATVSVEFHFPVEVTTLNGDARSVLNDKGDEIHAIIEDAVQDALATIEKRVGRIAGEWSGVSININ